MTTNELKVLEIIWDWGGEASVDIIAREAGVSIDYARLICESLRKENCIDFLHSKLCKIRSKGKIWVGKSKLRRARKIVILQKSSKFGQDKNKKGSLILKYG